MDTQASFGDKRVQLQYNTMLSYPVIGFGLFGLFGLLDMAQKPRQPESDQYSEKETASRRDEWLRRSLNTPPKPHKEVVAERKAKPKAKTDK